MGYFREKNLQRDVLERRDMEYNELEIEMGCKKKYTGFTRFAKVVSYPRSLNILQHRSIHRQLNIE